MESSMASSMASSPPKPPPEGSVASETAAGKSNPRTSTTGPPFLNRAPRKMSTENNAAAGAASGTLESTATTSPMETTGGCGSPGGCVLSDSPRSGRPASGFRAKPFPSTWKRTVTSACSPLAKYKPPTKNPLAWSSPFGRKTEARFGRIGDPLSPAYRHSLYVKERLKRLRQRKKELLSTLSSSHSCSSRPCTDSNPKERTEEIAKPVVIDLCNEDDDCKESTLHALPKAPKESLRDAPSSSVKSAQTGGTPQKNAVLTGTATLKPNTETNPTEDGIGNPNSRSWRKFPLERVTVEGPDIGSKTYCRRENQPIIKYNNDLGFRIVLSESKEKVRIIVSHVLSFSHHCRRDLISRIEIPGVGSCVLVHCYANINPADIKNKMRGKRCMVTLEFQDHGDFQNMVDIALEYCSPGVVSEAEWFHKGLILGNLGYKPSSPTSLRSRLALKKDEAHGGPLLRRLATRAWERVQKQSKRPYETSKDRTIASRVNTTFTFDKTPSDFGQPDPKKQRIATEDVTTGADIDKHSQATDEMSVDSESKNPSDPHPEEIARYTSADNLVGDSVSGLLSPQLSPSPSPSDTRASKKFESHPLPDATSAKGGYASEDNKSIGAKETAGSQSHTNGKATSNKECSFEWDGTFQLLQQDSSKPEDDSKPTGSDVDVKDVANEKEADDVRQDQGSSLCDESSNNGEYQSSNNSDLDRAPRSSVDHSGIQTTHKEDAQTQTTVEKEAIEYHNVAENEATSSAQRYNDNNEERLPIVRQVLTLFKGIASSIAENVGDVRSAQQEDEAEDKDEEDDKRPVGGDSIPQECVLMPPESNSESDADSEDLTVNSNQDSEQQNHNPLISISVGNLLVLALPLVGLAGIFWRLRLFDVSNSILEGCFRTFVQLHILGWLLSPIFKWGTRNPLLVACYALFMILLASHEASSRTKYTYDDQFFVIALSLVVNVGWVALGAFGLVLKPKPIWDPRYVLPIVGMLLGNSINGISIALDTVTTSLVERQAEIDLYLSFGASQFEAVSGIVAHAIQKGSTPALNMMCVVGIVSIPGMMTGQILGGASPMVAARYQAMIIFLIALSTLSTILVSSYLTITSMFCSHQILRPERLVRNHKRSLARLIMWLWGSIFGGTDQIPSGANMLSHGTEYVGQPSLMNLPNAKFQIRELKKGYSYGGDDLMQVFELSKHFVDHTAEIDRYRVLFRGLSLSVNEGDFYFVSGPNGSGKSQLLRILSGLSPFQDGTLRLRGKEWKDDFDGYKAVEWRKQIRYISQSKVQIPGTPRQFIKKIQSFRSWNTDYDAHSPNSTMKLILQYVFEWGLNVDCLDKDWSFLSGGESQRVLMAIAMSSRPKVLLFDESTSALDPESKAAVEASVMDFVGNHRGGVVWVSHDEQQADRLVHPPAIEECDAN